MDQPVPAPCLDVGASVRFLYVATQFEMKGGSALLRAWERVVAAAPGATLTVITHLPDAWRERAARLPGLTVVPAALRREEIAARYMANADVLVHPTYYDSFGMVALEALAHGLALVVTGIYALPELVDDGVNGRILTAPLSP